MTRSFVVLCVILSALASACGSSTTEDGASHSTEEAQALVAEFLSTATAMSASISAIHPEGEFLFGKVDNAVVAALDGEGDIAFALELLAFDGESTVVTIAVAASATLSQVTSVGVATTLTQGSAITALNASPFLVEVIGSASASEEAFEADLALVIYALPENFPYDEFPENVALGYVNPLVTPSLTLQGALRFQVYELIFQSGLENLSVTMTSVTVPTTATVQWFDETLSPSTITLAEALERMTDAEDIFVEAEGSEAGTSNGMLRQFTADLALRLIDASALSLEDAVFTTPGGNDIFIGTPGDDAALDGNDVTLTVEGLSLGGLVDAASYLATVRADADIFLLDLETRRFSALTPAQAVDELTTGVDYVELMGAADIANGTFEAWQTILVR